MRSPALTPYRQMLKYMERTLFFPAMKMIPDGTAPEDLEELQVLLIERIRQYYRCRTVSEVMACFVEGMAHPRGSELRARLRAQGFLQLSDAELYEDFMNRASAVLRKAGHIELLAA